MLRAVHRQNFVQILERSFFGLENFTVEFPTSGEQLLNIKFIPETRFSFQLDLPDKDGDYFSWETPAIEFVKRKPFISKSMEEAATRLENWAERVREEVISANPFSRELASFKQLIDRQLSEMQGQLDDFFSQEEAAELASRLEAFESRLSDLESKNTDLDAAVQALHKTVADLQGALSTVNRGTWLRMSAGRLLSGLKSVAMSKEGRELALEAAKKILLEGPK
jgi:polyhydroxyalkanoate synthesis regulator phasin